jgi:hypothetical protein
MTKVLNGNPRRSAGMLIDLRTRNIPLSVAISILPSGIEFPIPTAEVNMADEKKNQDFQWNRDPSSFTNFTKQFNEVQQITLGPDLSWPLMSKPGSDAHLARQREKVGRIHVTHERAA